MSLVPIASFGQRYGVAVGAIDAIIRMACIVHQTDYWRRGRTLAKLGIKQLAVHELLHYVETGELQRD
jgi:opine dehydrogenase